MDWALQQSRAKSVVISGFHSPLEQSVLKILIEAHSPVVAVLARPVAGARFPTEWAEPLVKGHMAVVSATTSNDRLTTELAIARNNLAAQLASQIMVIHASPGGTLRCLCEQWEAQGRQVNWLSSMR